MKLKCLIVEDALFMQEVYKFNLNSAGVVDIVGIVSDGVEALVQINKLKPDLIILDLVLPLKNGFDVLKEVSQLSPRSRCLVISSLDDPGTKTKALALGAFRYLTKPFSKSELLQAVQDISTSYSEVQNG